jgi:hypothetical protein
VNNRRVELPARKFSEGEYVTMLTSEIKASRHLTWQSNIF